MRTYNNWWKDKPQEVVNACQYCHERAIVLNLRGEHSDALQLMVLGSYLASYEPLIAG